MSEQGTQSTLRPACSPAPSSPDKRLRLQDYLPYRLSVAANAVSQLIARAYEDRFDLKIPQWRLIAVLAEESPLTPQELCERTLMDKVTVTRAAQGLLKRRLLKRQPHATDGRSHRLVLSSAGERLYSQIAPLALKYEVRLLDGLDPRDIDRLETQLRQLERAAEELRSR
ncbi:MAG: MarR family winged helix-turn-helix transcriptional regulator [Steroidobacteraceae bacterium]